jgi:hypothetical protein
MSNIRTAITRQIEYTATLIDEIGRLRTLVEELVGACETAYIVLEQVQAVEMLAEKSWNVNRAKEALSKALAKARGETQ